MTRALTAGTRLGALIAAAFVVASSACSSPEQPEAGGASEAPAGTESPKAGQNGSAGGASAQPRRVAVSRDQSVATSGDAIPVRADLAPLQRRGDVVVLNLSLTHTGDDSQWQISDDLDDGTANGLEGDDEVPARVSVDGISLIDGVNAKRHLVARDARGVCVCSTGLAGAFLKPGSTIVLSATFAAPPQDVDSLDVEIPVFGTFPAVPVES